MEIIFKSWKEVEERKIDEKNSTGLALGDGMGGRWEEGSGWGTHVHQWLIHGDVWQKKALQYCKVISLQLR